MSYRYFKPVIKFVSRKTAIEKLKLSEKQFDRLCVLLAVYPVIAESKKCYDKVDGWYYKIDDIKKIFYSDSYEILKKNTENEGKRQKLVQFQQLERAARIIDDEFSLVDLVKQKYETLGHSIDDLGNTVRNLYLIDLLEIENVKNELKAFEDFIVEKSLLNKAFMSKKGIYYGFSVEKIIVCWMVPYPGTDLTLLVEEKSENVGEKPDYTFDFLDFGSFDEEESEEEELVDPNDSEKKDISLLKYAFPLLKIHLNLMLHKLNKLYNNSEIKKNLVFRNTKFHVDIRSIAEQIKFVIRCGGGEIVESETADIIITESVDEIDNNKTYLQPQFIFDSLNSGKMVEKEDYLVGKELPAHSSPFPDVLETIDTRALRILSNKKKYSILDRVENLN